MAHIDDVNQRPDYRWTGTDTWQRTCTGTDDRRHTARCLHAVKYVYPAGRSTRIQSCNSTCKSISGIRPLYFPMVTFTSDGYGDMVGTGDRRMPAAPKGANGDLMSGRASALISRVIQDVCSHR